MSSPKKYAKDYFKVWSPDMAYVLGFLYADGNIVQTKRGNHYIAIYSADKPLLVAMRRATQSAHKIALRNASAGHVYRIQVGSSEWFNDLKRIGLTPNKSKRMCLPRVPSEFFGDFVRGYFDGDGNVWVGFVHKDRKTPLRVIQVAFTSGSPAYLKSLHLRLKKQGVQGGSFHRPKAGNYARLAFSVFDSLKIYKIMYNSPHKLYLKRKKIIFERFVQLRS